MTRQELTKEFIKVERHADRIQFSVMEIPWGRWGNICHGVWVGVTSLPADSGPEEIQVAIDGLLDDPRYFKTCVECFELTPSDWMDGTICQNCGTLNYGAIYW
ncbi:hypothetical protein CfE428DRAFT_5701 [Chthoniobacter flavus Ellin428]|uniref:Uncharacterized protein n=1 Tax=Chthoniobacter flavus Ellin428 TaxID=497964 RepID=B4D9Y4_9BACT|nr:hypothetical protein [Chthoniobacter flavus]EDY16738.1 hypothetical protein CfE428DRAFT_5701 [Chthoniobacter flavus Ellin428]TCO87856.1 hypothetical protein EV701_120155 [Chthoniobacter flavus]